MEAMLRRMARRLSWHSLLVHQPLEVSTSSRHTEARVALDIGRYIIYITYTIYTIYRRRSRSPRRPRQRPVLVEAEAGDLEAEDQVFPYLDTEKKEWFLAAAANNVTTLAIIDI